MFQLYITMVTCEIYIVITMTKIYVTVLYSVYKQLPMVFN